MKILLRNAIIEGALALALILVSAPSIIHDISSPLPSPSWTFTLIVMSLISPNSPMALAIASAVLAIINVRKILRGPLHGIGVVRRTDEEDLYDEPVHGSRIDLESGGSIDIRWNSSSPMAAKVHDLPEGTRVKVTWYPRAAILSYGGSILEDVQPLDSTTAVAAASM